MSEYKNPRPSATTSAASPAGLYDNAVTFRKLLNEYENQTTYQGKSLISWQKALDLFGFGVAPFDFATGGTLDSPNQLIKHSDGFFYHYIGSGSFPLTVDPATNPVGNPDWEAFTATAAELISISQSGSVQDHIDGGIGKSHDQIYQRNFDTLDDAINAAFTTASVGLKIKLHERISGEGGGAKWKIVLTSSVTPNGYNIVQSVAEPLISFVLQEQNPKNINPHRWGARKTTIGSITGPDNSGVTQAIIDYLVNNGGGRVQFGGGAYYFGSTVSHTVVNPGIGTVSVEIAGTGQASTELFTSQPIDMFTHQDYFKVYDLAFANRGLEGLTKHSGRALVSLGQNRRSNFERLQFYWFKFGQIQRFSLWNAWRDVTYNDCLCNLKLARNDDMENPLNPSPAGSWNESNGWFHNQNTFQNITFNGGKATNNGRGEIGFWGAVQGCHFDNITCQNYERDGLTPNQTIPIGQVSTCFQIEGGGPTSTRAYGNTITRLYIERSFKALKIANQDELLIYGLFTQGQSGGENLLEVSDSIVRICGQSNQTSGWAADIVATNSEVTLDRPLQSNGGASGRSLTNTYLSENGRSHNETVKTATVTLTPATSGTITLNTGADLVAYDRTGKWVTVTGRLDISAVSSPVGTYVSIGGLPYTTANLTDRAGSGAFSVLAFGGSPSPQSYIGAIIEGVEPRIYVDASTLTTAHQIQFTMTYVTNDYS